MAWILTSFLVLSLLSALLTGQVQALSAAVPEGAGRGITLAVSVSGPLCLWSGLNRLMETLGVTAGLSRLLGPPLGRLFPGGWQDPEIRDALSANVSANLLGLGSAATPPGIRAASLLARRGDSNGLCRLVVLNTASVQLLPTTVAAVRAGAGAAAPFDILPAVWITSLCSVTAGLLAAKVLSKWL